MDRIVETIDQIIIDKCDSVEVVSNIDTERHIKDKNGNEIYRTFKRSINVNGNLNTGEKFSVRISSPYRFLLTIDGKPYMESIVDNTTPLKDCEQWRQLKETISEIKDENRYENDDVTQLCGFLLNYMEVLEGEDSN